MTEYAIHSIDLAELPSKPHFVFIEAQWWDDQSPLVTIVCRHHGDVTKLRMDLDKKTFLDHLADPREDRAIQRLAIPVWEIIAKERFQLESTAKDRTFEY
jgi:hypothetical protein